MSRLDIIHSYRAFLRAGLRAIHFSKPARYTLVSRLRMAFAKNPTAAYDQQRVARTLEFLDYARKETGLEHKIVKNLLFVWYIQDRGGKGKLTSRILTNDEVRLRTTAYDAFNYNIEMLNESMGMCLPAMTTRDPL